MTIEELRKGLYDLVVLECTWCADEQYLRGEVAGVYEVLKAVGLLLRMCAHHVSLAAHACALHSVASCADRMSKRAWASDGA